MTHEMVALYGAAAIMALSHTLMGPDHYLPFVAMSRIGVWTLRKTVVVTMLCGIAHVLSSVVLGLFGIAFGIAVLKLENIESVRGDVAGWVLLAFGLAYTIWGIRQAIRNRPHAHQHIHADGTMHDHEHSHQGAHLHAHELFREEEDNAQITGVPGNSLNPSLTPWILFTIFLFGPCEPLIPLVMFPAALGHWTDVAIVTFIFGTVTVLTMTAIVIAALQAADGTSRLGGAALARFMGRFGHAFAGFVILACGAAMKVGL